MAHLVTATPYECTHKIPKYILHSCIEITIIQHKETHCLRSIMLWSGRGLTSDHILLSTGAVFRLLIGYLWKSMYGLMKTQWISISTKLNRRKTSKDQVPRRVNSVELTAFCGITEVVLFVEPEPDCRRGMSFPCQSLVTSLWYMASYYSLRGYL